MQIPLRQQAISYFVFIVAVAIILWQICSHSAALNYCSFTVVEGPPLLHRGANYGVGAVGYDPHNSTITSWHVMHALIYCALGVMAPSFWWVALIISVGFELWEQETEDCADQLDPFVNMIGFGIGMLLNKTLL